MEDKELGIKRAINCEGKIITTLKDGTTIINSHISNVDGQEMAFINGWKFNMNSLNIVKDFRTERA